MSINIINNITQTTVRPLFADLNFTKDELYFFGWFGFILALLLLCGCCVGCRSCCCRACCFSRETRTNLYVCKIPKKAGLNMLRMNRNPAHSVIPIEPEHQPVKTNCVPLLIDCECNYRMLNLGCNCRGSHHCRGPTQCTYCSVQPQSRCRVDKATATGTGPHRTEFEYLHGMSSPSPRGNGTEGRRSSSPERENFQPRTKQNSNQSYSKGNRGAGDMGFKVPATAWSYTNANPPPKPRPNQQKNADEEWE